MIQPRDKKGYIADEYIESEYEPINGIRETEVTSENVNVMGEMFLAIKRALLRVRENPEDDGKDEEEEKLQGNILSPSYFKHVAIDTGQFERIISSTRNTGGDIPFPAAFVRYTNVNYLVAQNRVGEGRAYLRLRYILNNVDNESPDKELEPFALFERINNVIQSAKDYEPALATRCNLQFFDMPQTCNMLQAYWIDYEIYFTQTKKNVESTWVNVKVVAPEFTNFSDIPGCTIPDADNPKYNDQSYFD